jgi:hypothetical protein
VAVAQIEVPIAVLSAPSQLCRHCGADAPDLFKAFADVYLCGLGWQGCSVALRRLHGLILEVGRAEARR